MIGRIFTQKKTPLLAVGVWQVSGDDVSLNVVVSGARGEFMEGEKGRPAGKKLQLCRLDAPRLQSSPCFPQREANPGKAGRTRDQFWSIGELMGSTIDLVSQTSLSLSTLNPPLADAVVGMFVTKRGGTVLVPGMAHSQAPGPPLTGLTGCGCWCLQRQCLAALRR